MTHGTADICVLREYDLRTPRHPVLQTQGPVLVGGQAELVVSATSYRNDDGGG